jgi:hypothetical protein
MAIGVASFDKLGVFSRSGIIFSTGGSIQYSQTEERMRIDSSGNVGIGTDSPSTLLDVRGEVSVAYDATYGLRFYNDARNNWSFIGNNVSGSSSANLRFGDATGEVMRITGGNVGIGTTSPGDPLTVIGKISSLGGTNNAKNIKIYANDSFGYVVTNASKIYMSTGLQVDSGLIGSYNEDLQLQVSGGTKMYLDSSGNVGIGTTSPGAGYAYDIKLDIVAPQLGGIPLRLVRDSSVTNYGAMLALAAKNSNSEIVTYGAIIGGIVDSTDGSEDGYVSIRTIKNGTEAEKVRVDEDGNVGIGTTSPEYKLDVRKNQAGYTYIASDNANTAASGTGSGFAMTESGTVAWYLRNERDGTGKFNIGNSANRLTIDSTGNVGIGVSPSQLLDVNGTALIRNTIYVGDDIQHWGDGGTGMFFGTDTISLKNDGGSTRLFVKSGGNVGIGTTNPNDKLNVHDSSASANLGIKITRGSQTHGLRLGVNDSHAFLWTDQNQDLVFATNNSQRVTILKGGNVGIGTTSPSEKLEVSGSIKVSNAYPRIYLADTQGVPRTFSIGTSNEDLIINSGSTDVLSILGASGSVGS